MTDVIAWFIWRRWFIKKWIKSYESTQQSKFVCSLSALHNNNVAGCRKHPIIYRDMCRIVRG